MALPAPRLDDTPLLLARNWARTAVRGAHGLDRAGWIVVLGMVVVAVGIASVLKLRPATEDPVLRVLGQAPADDEAPDPEEEAAVARARAEVSIPWEQARQDLAPPADTR